MLIRLSDMAWPSSESIAQVVREWEPDPSRWIGNQIIPLNTTRYNDSPTALSWDILAPARGMTHATALDANPTLVRPRTLKTVTQRPGYWREMKRVGERDMLHLRNVGPRDRERAGSFIIMHEMNELDIRVETLLEWSRWQALNGELAINDEGVIRTVQYDLLPAVTDVGAGDAKYWDEEGADPIADLQNGLDGFDGTDVERVMVVYNRKTAKLLANNAKVRDLVKGSPAALSLGTDNVGTLLKSLVGEIDEWVTYNKGYIDEAGVFQRFIPDGRVFLIGFSGNPGELTGEWASTPSLHNGGIDNATGGKFPMADYRGLEDTPPHIDLTNGIFGLPALYRPWRVRRLKVLA